MADIFIDDADEIRRLTEASAWRVALFEARAETSTSFEAWLASDERNAEAWKQVNAPWDLIGQDAMAPELIVARRDALERARRHQHRRVDAARGSGWIGGRIAASLLAVVLVGGLAGLGAWQATKPDVYQTALGERRTITLADGSRVALDSGTRLEVKLRKDARRLDLRQGQARFDVAHDTARPFTVHARDKTVVATGTSFNVDMLGAGVVVTLIEGRVSILQDGPRHVGLVGERPAPAVVARLIPGEQLIAAEPAVERTDTVRVALAPVVVTRANLERATSWETGQLVFDNEPLSAVVQRVGRYTDHPLVAEGRAGALRLSGVFDAGDVTTFVDAVQRVLPVAAERTPDGAIHLRTKGS